jgi:hypothetical protein
VYGNSTYNYSWIAAPVAIDGNISADPVFVQNTHPGADGV